jgi:hypothetical protein
MQVEMEVLATLLPMTVEGEEARGVHWAKVAMVAAPIREEMQEVEEEEPVAEPTGQILLSQWVAPAVTDRGEPVVVSQEVQVARGRLARVVEVAAQAAPLQVVALVLLLRQVPDG